MVRSQKRFVKNIEDLREIYGRSMGDLLVIDQILLIVWDLVYISMNIVIVIIYSQLSFHTNSLVVLIMLIRLNVCGIFSFNVCMTFASVLSLTLRLFLNYYGNRNTMV